MTLNQLSITAVYRILKAFYEDKLIRYKEQCCKLFKVEGLTVLEYADDNVYVNVLFKPKGKAF